MKACSRCGLSVGESAIKCPSCRALLVAPPASTVAAPSYAPEWTGAAPVPVLVTNGTSSRRRRASWKFWVKRALLVFVAFFVYSVVMDVRRDSAPYSNAHEKQFVSGCKHAGASEPSCRCSFEWMKAHVPAADFKAYIHDTNTPGYSPSQAPPWVYQAGQTCDVHT